MPISAKTPVTLSVSELNQLSRGVLEMHVGQIKVSGEVSNFTHAASGHWYFTLKDDFAQIRCAMFKANNRLLKQPIKHGMKIIVHGKVSLYEGRGDYQLIANFIEQAGAGSLQLRFEQLKQKLADEGLFAASRKKPIPKNIGHLAVITSSTGAAVHDILQVLNKRYALLKVTLIAASVQGDLAVPELCRALAMAEKFNQQKPKDAFDALIIGRGGGSLEDLWAFNEEALARAIAQCPIPTISAVGHEVDFSISDFVADLRAPTPSAAAEMISPDSQQLFQHLDIYEAQLKQRMMSALAQKKQQLQAKRSAIKQPKQLLSIKRNQMQMLLMQLQQNLQEKLGKHRQQLQIKRLELKHPQQILNQHKNQLILLHTQLQQNLQQQLKQTQQQLNLKQQQLISNSPINNIKAQQNHLLWQQAQLHKACHQQVQKKQLALQNQAQLLNTLSPLTTLQRGYSISKTESGQIIRDKNQVKTGDLLQSQLHDGIIISQVIQSKDLS